MGYLHKVHGMTLLGKTLEGTCPECAVKHSPEEVKEFWTQALKDHSVDKGV